MTPLTARHDNAPPQIQRHKSLAYLKREESAGASDFVNSVIWTLEFRLVGEYNDFQAVREGTPDYIEFCEHVMRFYEKFDLDEDIYGDLRTKIMPILARLKEG
jgi:hypothetical protein